MSAALFLKEPGPPATPPAASPRPRSCSARRCPTCRAPEIDEGPRGLPGPRPRQAAPAAAALPRGPARPDRRAHAAHRRPGARLRRVRARRSCAWWASCASPTGARGCSTCSGSCTASTPPSTCATLEQRSQSLRRGKQSLHPLLQSFYRRIDQECRRARDQNGGSAFAESPALVASIIDDGFAFTEASADGARPRELPGLEQALPHRTRGVLRDPADAGARSRAAAARGRPRAAGARWRVTCRSCRASTT